MNKPNHLLTLFLIAVFIMSAGMAQAQQTVYYNGNVSIVQNHDGWQILLGTTVVGHGDGVLDVTNLPPAFKNMLDFYATQKESSLKKHSLKKIDNTTKYGPYLTTSWSQAAPYNKKCPKIVVNDQIEIPTVLGSHTISTAQVLFYYGYCQDFTVDASVSNYTHQTNYLNLKPYVDNVDVMMDASDVIITKPGGLTTSEALAKKVSEEVDGFLKVLSRENIIRASLDNFGYIIVADTIDEAINTVNDIASEHLEILTVNPFETMTKIKNAGAIFLGDYSSEPLGDYFAGPNHILPTNGTSRFFSPLSVDDFIKKTSIISYSKDALSKVHDKIELFAKNEGLTAHANSIAVRFEK